MGYGRSVSRFTERKRVVKDHNVGPLIKTDMTRCIHCTRCVRFLEEVAGTCEMGGVGRGDRLEITSGIEKGIHSEVSGNIIDLCPVGALTNKPFRYSARAWELMAKPSVALHDGLGTRLWYHARQGRVMRSVPLDSEYSEHPWISDRDRYSHFGLYAGDRVTTPLIKRDGEWVEADWTAAIEAAATALRETVAEGGDALGVLMSPSALNEEYYLAQRLVRELGCGNIDHRLRELDFSDDAARPAAPVFERGSDDVARAGSVLLVGSRVRHEMPVLGLKVREAQQAGATVAVINPVAWPVHFDITQHHVAPPQQMVGELAALANAAGARLDGALANRVENSQPDDSHRAIAAQLKGAEGAVVIVGQWAMSHPQAAVIRALSRAIADATGAALNLLAPGGNAAGAARFGAVPGRGPGGAERPAGLDAGAMLAAPRPGYLLWGFEPDFDTANPSVAMQALESAQRVVAVAAYATDSLRAVADVILPLAPAPESEGSMITVNGDWLPVAPAGKVTGEARPGWKILRRLADELDLEGFDFVALDGVQAEMRQAADGVSPKSGNVEFEAGDTEDDLWRVGEVPMNAVDAMTRRAVCLQQADEAAHEGLRISAVDARRLGLSDGGRARVRQGDASAEMVVVVTDTVPPGAVWVPAATCTTRTLGAINGPVRVEVA
ncbi:MAG: molybdopterin-dependent oxidoreductase, partial [Xanthomonadales bacterium]|nr:molybdopterin-dependent oxidoreductase [Xanthomonadales bacterium]